MDEIPEGLRVAVTHHALARYRERFDPLSAPADVEAAVRRSVPAAGAVRRWCEESPTRHPGHQYRVCDGVLFVVAYQHDDRRVLVVVTAISVGQIRHDRGKAERRPADRGKSAPGLRRSKKGNRRRAS